MIEAALSLCDCVTPLLHEMHFNEQVGRNTCPWSKCSRLKFVFYVSFLIWFSLVLNCNNRKNKDEDSESKL